MRAKIFLLCLLLSLMLLNSANAKVSGNNPEDVALAQLNSTNPIVLHLDPDTSVEAQQLAALNGVDRRRLESINWSCGPMGRCNPEANSQFCIEYGRKGDRLPDLLDLHAKIIGYENFDRHLLFRWLVNKKFINIQAYTISYPNVISPDWGTKLTYYCPIIGNGNSNGLNIPIGQRQFTKWTYRKQYVTPFPGKGNVKVFSGSFAYKIVPKYPEFTFIGEGSVTIKAYLDPDNGRWVIINWETHDPSISLASAGPLVNIPEPPPLAAWIQEEQTKTKNVIQDSQKNSDKPVAIFNYIKSNQNSFFKGAKVVVAQINVMDAGIKFSEGKYLWFGNLARIEKSDNRQTVLGIDLYPTVKIQLKDGKDGTRASNFYGLAGPIVFMDDATRDNFYTTVVDTFNKWRNKFPEACGESGIPLMEPSKSAASLSQPVVTPTPGPATPEPAGQDNANDSLLLGEWINQDSNTRGYTRFIIRSEGDMTFIHIYGRCHPKECDGGEVQIPTVKTNTDSFTLTKRTSFANYKYTFKLLSNGSLSVTVETVFIDNSRRKPYSMTDLFYKSVSR